MDQTEEIEGRKKNIEKIQHTLEEINKNSKKINQVIRNLN